MIEETWIGGRRSDFFTAGKLAPGNLGLLQQNLPLADLSKRSKIASPFGRSAEPELVIQGPIELAVL